MLSSGIDSLYVSIPGELRPEVAVSLGRLKAEARDNGQGQTLKLAGARRGVVQPSGWGRYRFWVRCQGFDVFLGSGSSLPAAYVQVRSSFIHEVGPQNALTEVSLFLKGLVLNAVRGSRCSRVDIYSDFQGWLPQSIDYDRFVVRSRRNVWHAAVHHDGRRFTGFTFGRDAIVARLYDKSLEIKHSGKDWMREVWGGCLDPSQAVWRLEFQLLRQVLRECGLNDPDEVIEHRNELWHYATQWLSLRESRAVVRRVRWPIADVWAQLAQSRVEPPVSPLVRKRIKKHDESVLVRGMAGYASSLAAISGVSDLDVTLTVSRRRLAAYLAETGRDFRDLVHVKVDRNLRD